MQPVLSAADMVKVHLSLFIILCAGHLISAITGKKCPSSIWFYSSIFVGHEDSIKIVEIIPVQFPQDQAENPNFHGGMLHFHRAARSAGYLQDNLYKRILKRDIVPNNIYKYLRVN